MSEKNFNVINPANGVHIKAWTKGVPLDGEAEKQLLNVAQMPFIHRHIAVMPDVHWGMGAITFNFDGVPSGTGTGKVSVPHQ